MFRCKSISTISQKRVSLVLTVYEDGGPISPDGGTPSHNPGKYMDMLASDGSIDDVCEAPR